MAKVNPHFQKLRTEYVFNIIEQKLADLQQKVPAASVVNLGIGDIALPLAPKIVSAICRAVEEMGREESMKGYGPSTGYSFLKEAIVQNEYGHLGIAPDEVFISDGANTDTVNIQEIFRSNAIVGITDPTYPAYFATNVMAGREPKIRLLPAAKETHFVPLPPKEHCDFVYLCTPSNPTGVAMNRNELTAWVEYAKKEGAVLFIDNAYAAFATSPDVPKSIYEIEGAKEVAIEFRSFSKSAGFTGLRCAYTVLPRSVYGFAGRKKISLHSLWNRRQSTKSNGVAYPIQKGAEAVFTPEGSSQTQAQVKSYLSQAKALLEGLKGIGQECFGGVDAPYIWWKGPQGMSSWEFFDLLMDRCHLISIPGKAFGSCGEGYVRLSAFTTPDKTTEALKRIQRL